MEYYVWFTVYETSIGFFLVYLLITILEIKVYIYNYKKSDKYLLHLYILFWRRIKKKKIWLNSTYKLSTYKL